MKKRATHNNHTKASLGTEDRYRFLKISPTWLLVVYSCIPVALILIFIDTFVLKGLIGASTEVSDPQDLAVFTLLFTLPHILSSFFGFIDKEYFGIYGKRILRGTQYAVVAALILPIISLGLAFIVFALLTMYHVFRQQSGIARSIMRTTNAWYGYWEWAGIILSFALYIEIYSELTVPISATYLWVIALIPYTFFASMAVKASSTKVGMVYFWVTHLIPITSGLFLLLGYPIFSIILPRIIHDVTAYTFYITHDHNRYLARSSNYLYRLSSRLWLPVGITSLLLSIGLAFLVQRNLFPDVYILLTVLFLLHYYNESFMWKRGSIHRQYIEYAR